MPDDDFAAAKPGGLGAQARGALFGDALVTSGDAPGARVLRDAFELWLGHGGSLLLRRPPGEPASITYTWPLAGRRDPA